MDSHQLPGQLASFRAWKWTDSEDSWDSHGCGWHCFDASFFLFVACSSCSILSILIYNHRYFQSNGSAHSLWTWKVEEYIPLFQILNVVLREHFQLSLSAVWCNDVMEITPDQWSCTGPLSVASLPGQDTWGKWIYFLESQFPHEGNVSDKFTGLSWEISEVINNWGRVF